MTLQLLLIENGELGQSESLLTYLEKEGYQVVVAHNLEMAVEKTETLWPNLIVFSPSNSHLKLSNFQELIGKTKLKIPCIIVCGENHIPIATDVEIIVIAPNQPHQLKREIKEITTHQKDRFIRLPNLIIDCQQHQVLRHKERHQLTPKEFKLLRLLIDNHQDVMSRKTIMQTVWETDYMGDTRTLDVHIRWLREKIEDNPSHPKRLITVRGVGYRFMMDVE